MKKLKLQILSIARDFLLSMINISRELIIFTTSLSKRALSDLEQLSIRLRTSEEYRSREATLVEPSILVDVSNEFLALAKCYYNDGIVIFENQSLKLEIQTLLSEIKAEFLPMLNYYDQAESIYRRNFLWDRCGRRWYINKPKGVLQLNIPFAGSKQYFAGRSDSIFSEQLDLYDTDSLSKDIPLFEMILDDEFLEKFSAYSNNGHCQPLSLLIERRTHATQADKDDFLPHVDALNNGVFKSFIYLNDVDRESGPLYISKGSHHWGLYPKLLHALASRKAHSVPDAYIGNKFDWKTTLGINPCRPIVGSAGHQLLFSANALHHASNPRPNRERWTIQIYYYSGCPWATDKTNGY